jgi:hypothetical protein
LDPTPAASRQEETSQAPSSACWSGVSGNGQTEEGGSRMACITTKHGKTGDPLLRCQQEAPHHKTEGTKEEAQVRLDEILKEGKQSVNTKTNFKDYGQW